MSAFAPAAGVLRECRERWGLVADGAFASSYSYVEPVRTADGTPAVLRLGVPESDELDALEWFSGRGGVRVLAIDRARGAALLERALPGTHLPAGEDAIAIAAEVMRALWRPPDGAPRFHTVREWGRALSGRPAARFAELCDSMADPVVLHCDLHHENVLRAGADRWVAIDPKGVIGEPAYETGALLRNPRPDLLAADDPARVLRRRSAQLAEALSLDLQRVREWAYVQAELSAAWHVEDGEDPAFALAVAELLEPLTRGR
jgi:streptomycin 6-kinase